MTTITTNESENGITAVISGFFDTDSYSGAMEALKPVLDNADRNIILECSDLQYVSSSALRIFLMIRKKVRESGGSLVLRGICEQVKQVFAVSGFLPLFTFE